MIHEKIENYRKSIQSFNTFSNCDFGLERDSFFSQTGPLADTRQRMLHTIKEAPILCQGYPTWSMHPGKQPARVVATGDGIPVGKVYVRKGEERSQAQETQQAALLQNCVQKDIKTLELAAELARHRQDREARALMILRQEHQGP
jgi:hypothetical protein